MQVCPKQLLVRIWDSKPDIKGFVCVRARGSKGFIDQEVALPCIVTWWISFRCRNVWGVRPIVGTPPFLIFAHEISGWGGRIVALCTSFYSLLPCLLAPTHFLQVDLSPSSSPHTVAVEPSTPQFLLNLYWPLVGVAIQTLWQRDSLFPTFWYMQNLDLKQASIFPLVLELFPIFFLGPVHCIFFSNNPSLQPSSFVLDMLPSLCLGIRFYKKFFYPSPMFVP